MCPMERAYWVRGTGESRQSVWMEVAVCARNWAMCVATLAAKGKQV